VPSFYAGSAQFPIFPPIPSSSSEKMAPYSENVSRAFVRFNSNPGSSGDLPKPITLPPALVTSPHLSQTFEDDDITTWLENPVELGYLDTESDGTQSIEENRDSISQPHSSSENRASENGSFRKESSSPNSFQFFQPAEKGSGLTLPQDKNKKKLSLHQAKSFVSDTKLFVSEILTTIQDTIQDTVDHVKDGKDKDKDKEKEGVPSESILKKELPIKVKLTFLQNQISKDRNRFVNDQYDLDLSYITPRIIAMAMPGQGLESAFRNDLDDVAGLLESEHGNGYMVYNLSERAYDTSKLNDQVLDFGWPDHQAPPLKLLFAICKSIDSWLRSEDKNVVVIHCKGGKGRTGTVICSYFLYSGLCKTADEAVSRFGSKRMAGEKVGVTQPSQRRFIKYFKWIIYREINLNSSLARLQKIVLNKMPGLDRKGRISPLLRIYQGSQLVFASATKENKESIKSYNPQEGPITFYMDVILSEDVMVQCFHFSVTGIQKLFRAQFFIGCLNNPLLKFQKEELDDACINKKFPEDSSIELYFMPFQQIAQPHFLETFIPDDIRFKSGVTCYFNDPEQNAKYIC